MLLRRLKVIKQPSVWHGKEGVVKAELWHGYLVRLDMDDKLIYFGRTEVEFLTT